MAAFGNSPYGQMAMAAALRNQQNTAPSGQMQIVPPAMGGLQAGGGGGQQGGQQEQSSNPISPQSANNLMKYFKGLQGGGATAEAGQLAMPEMAAGGGSDLGSMGLMGQSSVSFPGASAVGGSGGSSAAGGGMSGMLGSAGGLAALAAAAYVGDKEMNENKGSIINADKLNNMGTVGDSGIGLRFGDFANGFNPATWLSDPKKAAKGLGNAFTFGLLDKVI